MELTGMTPYRNITGKGLRSGVPEAPPVRPPNMLTCAGRFASEDVVTYSVGITHRGS
jgi:hypothetical protein